MKKALEGRGKREEGRGARFFFLSVFFFLLLSSFSFLAHAEPFFVTIEKVELKNTAGEWVTVIEPDKKVDLSQGEATVSFFNNGRVVPGKYINVRVRLDKGLVSRAADYTSPLDIKKGSFVNVSFEFDLNDKEERKLLAENFKQIQLTVDDDERLDGADKIKIGD